MKSLMICVTLVAAFFIGADSMARRQDMMTTAVTPDASTNDTDNSSNSTDTMTTMAAPVDGNNNMDDNITTDAVTTSTPAPVTQAPPAVTTTPIPVAACNKSLDKIEAVFAFTNEPGFRELSDNEMILIYELLAAGEGCKMSAYINAETAERIFRLLGDLRLKHVFTIVNYVSSSLQNEGVIVPN